MAAGAQQLPAVQHGRILFVDEVLSQAPQLHGAAVRVLGHLTSYHAPTGAAVIAHRDCQLDVDTSLASPVVSYEPPALLQFIGELDTRDGAGEARRPVLRARVARRVDGLDLALYEQALAVRRRAFEAASQQQGAAQ